VVLLFASVCFPRGSDSGQGWLLDGKRASTPRGQSKVSQKKVDAEIGMSLRNFVRRF
jgi:hypothetical protein